MTNREWLESLSDEELAKKSFHMATSGLCEMCYFFGNNCSPISGCINGIEKWFQAEHKDEE